jgi:hypothetical protein
MKNANNTLKEEMINKLLDERGYDIPYLKSLTIKELKCIYDTEFYFEIQW